MTLKCWLVKDPDNLLGWVSTPIDFFFRKLVGGFNPKWKKKCAFRKNGGFIFPKFRGEDSQKICELPAPTVYPYESWLSIADWRCLHPSAAPPFVQEQLEVLPLGWRPFNHQFIKPFVNLCTVFYIHLVFSQRKISVGVIPDSKVVFKKKCWQGRFGMKKVKCCVILLGSPRLPTRHK